MHPQSETSHTTLVRHHGLDAARAVALFIGIFHHGIESFISYVKWDWITQDTQESIILDILFYVSHVFRMQAFFLMSGFFAHLLLKKLGTGGFMVNRAKRLVLPFVIFWPILYFTTYNLWVWGIHTLRDSTTEQKVAELPDYMLLSHGFPLMHLWFLYFLILYCVLVVVYQTLISRMIDPHNRIARMLIKAVSYCSPKWWGSLLIGLIMVLPMLGMTDEFGVDTSASSLIPMLAPFVLYGLYFLLGWIIFLVPQLWNSMSRFKSQNLLTSIVLIVLLIGLNLAVKGTSLMSPILVNGLINFVYAFASVTAVFAFIGFMISCFSSASLRIRYLSDSSYWGYLIHLPLVGFFQILVAPYDWFWGFKLVLIFVPVIILLYISYKYFVRTTIIGRLLNGATKSQQLKVNPLRTDVRSN
jgi:hypothetical protein